MARTSLLEATDRIMNGGLAEFISHHRAAGVSWSAMARLLKAEQGIEVTRDTLRRWALELGLERPERVEAAS